MLKTPHQSLLCTCQPPTTAFTHAVSSDNYEQFHVSSWWQFPDEKALNSSIPIHLSEIMHDFLRLRKAIGRSFSRLDCYSLGRLGNGNGNRNFGLFIHLTRGALKLILSPNGNAWKSWCGVGAVELSYQYNACLAGLALTLTLISTSFINFLRHFVPLFLLKFF